MNRPGYRGLAGRKDVVTWFPRASAFGLSPGLGSAGPLGRVCLLLGLRSLERIQGAQIGSKKLRSHLRILDRIQEAQIGAKEVWPVQNVWIRI